MSRNEHHAAGPTRSVPALTRLGPCRDRLGLFALRAFEGAPLASWPVRLNTCKHHASSALWTSRAHDRVRTRLAWRTLHGHNPSDGILDRRTNGFAGR